MTTIVAGRCVMFDEVEGGARRRYAQALGPDGVSIFFPPPRGLRARVPVETGRAGAVPRRSSLRDEGAAAAAKRDSGAILAAHVTPGNVGIAVHAPRAIGAISIECNEGGWRDGEWRDFDPVRHPR